MEQLQQYNTFEEMAFPAEEWQAINGTNEKYFVSSFGRVAHVQKNGKIYILSPWYDKHYKRVSIRIDGKRVNLYVHRLVA